MSFSSDSCPTLSRQQTPAPFERTAQVDRFCSRKAAAYGNFSGWWISRKSMICSPRCDAHGSRRAAQTTAMPRIPSRIRSSASRLRLSSVVMPGTGRSSECEAMPYCGPFCDRVRRRLNVSSAIWLVKPLTTFTSTFCRHRRQMIRGFRLCEVTKRPWAFRRPKTARVSTRAALRGAMQRRGTPSCSLLQPSDAPAVEGMSRILRGRIFP